MSEERLWKFRKPEWMNSATGRSAGVYGAGALVCLIPSHRSISLVRCSTSHLSLALPHCHLSPSTLSSTNSSSNMALRIYFRGNVLVMSKPLLTHLAGSQFSLSFFTLLDAAVFSHSPLNGSDPPVHITFIDWLPLIFSALGMLIINSIEKTRLSADSFSYSGSGVAWKARVVLFLGFASLAGGMAGGVTVLVLKYIVPGAVGMTLYMGIANVAANALVMLRYVFTSFLVLGRGGKGLGCWLMCS